MRPSTTARSRIAATLVCSLFTACAAGASADAIRSDAPSATDAMGDEAGPACGTKPAYGEPLVVDLPSKARLDLELAMRGGVPVVRYDCQTLEVLPGCRLDGGFEYAGVSVKEDVVTLNSRDEVRANLPISGATLAAGLERGSSLQLALAMVGKQSTTVREAMPADLVGDCGGATHFVRAAVLGAFALQRGSDASVGAAAEIFGAGVKAGSDTARDVTMRDGDVDACRGASPEASKPPPQCSSSLRLELVALAEQRSDPDAGEPAPAAWVDPCPDGYRLAAGKCSLEPAEAYVCAPSDRPDCLAQCEAGNAESCFHAAVPEGVSTMDVDERPAMSEVVTLLDKACEAGSARGCSGLSVAYELGSTVTQDIGKAGALLSRGCELGDGPGCYDLASRLAHDWPRSKGVWTRDDARATKLYQRACDLADERGCFKVAQRYFQAIGTPKNDKRGKAVLLRGCDAGSPKRCTELGMLMLGLLGPGKKYDGIQDVPVGLEILERSCRRDGYADACLLLAKVHGTGTGVTKDMETARQYHRKACPTDDAPKCESFEKFIR